MKNLESILNKRQVEAIKKTQGPLLIIAGAGSGKTRVITYKIAYLIFNNYAKPFEITAMTFTNKATQEMKQRVKEILKYNYSDMNNITISTFHSFCAKVLRKHIDKIGRGLNFVIYDSNDQKTLIKRLLEKNEIDTKEMSPRDVSSIFASVKNGVSSFFEGSKLVKVFKDYEEELEKVNALDFVDLLRYTFKLFKERSDVLEYYQDRAKFLFVDEYQDTNKIQYKIIKLLAKKHNNLCVVGDEDQSIYKWRGADISNILSFEKDFKNASIIKLEQNYRSTGNIIGASSSLISNNNLRKQKKLFTEREKGEKIKLKVHINDIEEANFVVSEINKLYLKGHSYKDISIFYRINAQSRILEEKLRRFKVPYKIVGGIRFYDRQEIRDLISYLKLVVNSSDNNSLIRILNTPNRSIGKKTLEKIILFSEKQNLSIFEALNKNLKDINLSKKINSKIENFINLINSLIVLNKNKENGSFILKEILERTEYIDFLKDKKGLEADDKIDNVSELLNAMIDFEEKEDNKSLLSYLESVSLLSDNDIEEGRENGVSLMTLHSAKGLEFPVVFIYGLEEGMLPYVRYGENEACDIEEERRLFYVGMTRAKNLLYLTWAKSRRVFGSIRARHKSIFLDEINNSFIEKEEIKKYFNKTFFKQEKNHEDIEIKEEISLVGKTVEHPNYGYGYVRQVEGKGDRAKITVNFKNYGTKKLIYAYANLIIK
jgi:DNA helicase II / ATP-dependent DNA helicase PcrA